MFLIDTLPQQIWLVCMLAVAGFAYWRGGWPERTVALATIVGSVAGGALQNTHDWTKIQWGDMAVDVAYLWVVLFVAIRSDRFWPLFAAAFQLISVFIYIADMADRGVGPRAPYLANVIWSYLILICIVVGTGNYWRRQRPSPATGISTT
jgi:hypothetical protein